MNSKDNYAKNFGKAYCENLPTLATAMNEILSFFGAQRIYGVGGDYVAPLIKSFEEKFKVLPSSNELNAGYSACASAEINGLGICLITYTVGSLPCITAAALAKSEHLPVVFISGAPGESEINSGPLHHVIHSSDSWRVKYDAALNAFAELGIRSERLQGPRSKEQPGIANEQFYRLLEHAYLKREPVFIEIPRDLPQSFVQKMTLPKSLHDLDHDFHLLSGAELIAREIADRLNSAKCPMLFIGEKYRGQKELIDELRSFCESLQIPYASNLFAKGLFDENSPLSLGYYNGVFSEATTREFVEKKCDYVLEVGTSIFPQDTASAFATGTHIIDAFANKTSLKGTTTNGKDIAEVFRQLRLIKIKKHTNPWIPTAEPAIQNSDKLGFNNLSVALNALQKDCPRTFVYLPEIGNSFFASFRLKPKIAQSGRSWLTNPWYAAMGTSLPYARAVCHRLIDQQFSDIPIVITGDGGFHFQCNELIHFYRENLFVVILYMNNGIFHLGKTGDAEIYQCSDTRFNPIKLIEAYGGEGTRCTTWKELQQSFKAIYAKNQGLHLIEIPAGISENEQSPEIQLLNLYIKSRSGDLESVSAWKKLR